MKVFDIIKQKGVGMIFISGILYLLALIVGFFIEIPRGLLVFFVLLFTFAIFRERGLVHLSKKSKINMIIALLISIFLILILSIIQEKLGIKSFSFINDKYKFNRIYLGLGYFVINFILDGLSALKEK